MSFPSTLARVGQIFQAFTPRNRPGIASVSAAFVPLSRRRSITSHNVHPHQLKLLAESLVRAAVRNSSLLTIRHAYDTLVHEVTRLAPPASASGHRPLSRDALGAILGALGRSGRPGHVALAGRIVDELPTIFGFERTKFHTLMIEAFVRGGNSVTARHWLVTMQQMRGRLVPTPYQWHLLLDGHVAQDDLEGLFASISKMPRSGIQPTQESFEKLIKLITSLSAPPADVVRAIEAIHRARVPYSEIVSDWIFNHVVKYGGVKQASELQRSYSTAFKHRPASEDAEVVRDPDLRQTTLIFGMKEALKRYLALPSHKVTPIPNAMATLLGESVAIENLRYVERKLGFRAEAKHWSILIRNAVRRGNVAAAMEIFAEAIASGIQPDSPMAHPIISTLCQTAFRQPSDDDIDQALGIYNQLLVAALQPNTISRGSQRAPGPDASVYTALLRALSSAPDVAKYHPIALSLVTDMKALGIMTTQPMMTASLISIFMRHSSSYEEAFEAYRQYCEDAGVSCLDEKGFAVVLNVFCKLSFGPSANIPPLALYFEIVKDMRNAGYCASSGHIYAILWRRLAYLAMHQRQGESDFQVMLIAAIRQSHDHLTLDASVTPNTVLWNQLMDTYQRSGCFEEAYKIWDMMYLMGTFNEVSVTTIIDACGHAGIGDIADTIWSRLRTDQYPITTKNWLTWLECLCRLGRLEEAVKTACTEMPGPESASAVERVRILLTFAIQRGEHSKIKAHILRYFPEAWEKLPEQLRVI